MTDGREFDIFAKIQAGIDGLGADVERLHKKMDRTPPQPINREVGFSGATNGGRTVLTICLGAPAQGRVWNVRQMVVGGATPTTTAAGRADVFIVNDDPATGAPQTGDLPGRPGFRSSTGLKPTSLNYWYDQETSLPNRGYFGRGELVVVAESCLWVVFSNVTAAQQYTALARVEEYELAAYQIVRQT